MDKPRLAVEVIPTSLHGKNPRSINGKAWWERNRKATYEAAGYRCEVCGGVGKAHRLEAHERYEYDESGSPPCQRLLGLIALCPACHAVKHLYRTRIVATQQGDPSIYEQALRHLAGVNSWTPAQVDAYLAEVGVEFRRREALGPWTYDFSTYSGSGR